MMQKLLNAHPAINFETAYTYIKAIGDRVRNDLLDRESLLKAMGFKTATGNASNAIGSLGHFGLLVKVEGGYLLPKSTRELLALKIGSEEWRDKALSAATKPELYKKLFKTYKADLPASLANDLVKEYGNRNIHRKNVDRVIKNYRESLRFVGYSVNEQPTRELSLEQKPSNVIEVNLGGNTISIAKRYLLEAYEKTLKDDLILVQESLKSL
jgi:hypothetical protein